MTAVLDPPRDRPRAAGTGPVVGVVRVALLGAWLLVVVAGFLLAERPSTWDDLEQAAARGEVDAVVVRGDLGLEGRGYTSADVVWREGLLAHRTEVVMARPREAGVRQVRRGTFPAGTLVTSHDVGTLLTGLDLDVRVESGPRHGGATFEAFPGWQVRSWVAGVALGAFVATLLLLALGPETRRATQWAWFWLLLTPFAPLVAVGLLVFGYPTRFLPPGHAGRHGLRGGWAFVVSLILGAFAST